MARKPPVKLPDVFAKPGRAPSRGTPIEALPREPGAETPASNPRVETAKVPDVPTTVNPRVADVVVADVPTTVNPQVTDAAAPAPDFPTMVNPQTADTVEATAAPVAAIPTTVNAQVTDAVTTAPAAEPETQPAAWARPSTPSLALPVAVDPKPVPPPPVPPPPVPPHVPLAVPPTVVAAPPKPAPEPPPIIHQPAAAPHHPPVTVPPPRGPAWAIAMMALGVSLTTPFWYDGALRMLGITRALNQAQQEDALAITRQERTLQDVQQRLTTANTQLSKARTDLTEAARRQEETTSWTRTMILVRLSETLRRGAPFMAEVAMVRSSGAATGDLQPLVARVVPYAPIGVPTAVDLASDFRRVTDPVLRPARGFNPIAWAATVVAWTPFGRPVAETDPGRVALREAGARMRDGQINEAVAILRPVTGPVAEMMAGWLADTDARAAADALAIRVDALLRAGRH